MTKKYLDELTYRIIGCCIDVHKAIGPALLESVYHRCLKAEFAHKDIKYNSKYAVPIRYRNVNLETDLRVNFLIEENIILELKAVEFVHPVHEAKVLTYMKLLEKPKGIIVNFNCINIFKEGQKTFVNEYFRSLPES